MTDNKTPWIREKNQRLPPPLSRNCTVSFDSTTSTGNNEKPSTNKVKVIHPTPIISRHKKAVKSQPTKRLVVRDWMLSSHMHHAPGQTLQVLPFQSELMYRQQPPYSGHQKRAREAAPHMIPASKSMSPPSSPSQPPVAEIAIPATPASIVGESRGDMNDTSTVATEEQEVSYQERYLESQRELHTTKQQLRDSQEENRMLKRYLFQLQRESYTRKRNKCRNVSWSVPPSRGLKRQRVTFEDCA